jgi:hypothetical protein
LSLPLSASNTGAHAHADQSLNSSLFAAFIGQVMAKPTSEMLIMSFIQCLSYAWAWSSDVRFYKAGCGRMQMPIDPLCQFRGN